MPVLMVCLSQEMFSVVCEVAKDNDVTPEAALVAMAEECVCLRAGEPCGVHRWLK
jgi:hypothetical protein